MSARQHRLPRCAAAPLWRWAIEIKRCGDRIWLSAFETPKLAARVFDMVVWRLDDPRGLLNFPEVESRNEDRAIRREYIWMDVRQSDEADMAVYRAAHPKHVAVELEYYVQLATQKAAVATSGAATSTPSSTGQAAAGPSSSALSSITVSLIRDGHHLVG
jgi:hypothetical protein